MYTNIIFHIDHSCIFICTFTFSDILRPFLSLDWIGALIFALLGPFILISLHTLCTKTACKPALPFNQIPKTLNAYYDQKSLLTVVAFGVIVRVLSLLPLGSTVRAVSGKEIRMNGFVTLLVLMALMPVLVYKKVDLRFDFRET